MIYLLLLIAFLLLMLSSHRELDRRPGLCVIGRVALPAKVMGAERDSRPSFFDSLLVLYDQLDTGRTDR